MKQRPRHYGIVPLRNGRRLFDGVESFDGDHGSSSTSITTRNKDDDAADNNNGDSTNNAERQKQLHHHYVDEDDEEDSEEQQNRKSHSCTAAVAAAHDDAPEEEEASFRRLRQRLAVLRLTGRRNISACRDEEELIDGKGGSDCNQKDIMDTLVVGRNEFLMTMYAACGCDLGYDRNYDEDVGTKNDCNIRDDAEQQQSLQQQEQRKRKRRPFVVSSAAVASRCQHCQQQTSWAKRFLSRQMLQFSTPASSSTAEYEDANNDGGLMLRFRGRASIWLNGAKLSDSREHRRQQKREVYVSPSEESPEEWSNHLVHLRLGDRLCFRRPGDVTFHSTKDASRTDVDEDDELEFQVVELINRKNGSNRGDDDRTIRLAPSLMPNSVDRSTKSENDPTASETALAAAAAATPAAVTESTPETRPETNDVNNSTAVFDGAEKGSGFGIATAETRRTLTNRGPDAIIAVTKDRSNTEMFNSACLSSAAILPARAWTDYKFPPSFGSTVFVVYLAVQEDPQGDFSRGIEQCRQIIGDDHLHYHHIQSEGTRHVAMWSGRLSSQQANQVSLRRWKDTSKMTDLLLSFNEISFTGLCQWGGTDGLSLKLSDESNRHLKRIVQSCIDGLPYDSASSCDHLSLYRLRGAQGWAAKNAQLAFSSVNETLRSYKWGTVKPNSIRLKAVGTDYSECRVIHNFNRPVEQPSSRPTSDVPQSPQNNPGIHLVGKGTSATSIDQPHMVNTEHTDRDFRSQNENSMSSNSKQDEYPTVDDVIARHTPCSEPKVLTSNFKPAAETKNHAWPKEGSGQNLILSTTGVDRVYEPTTESKSHPWPKEGSGQKLVSSTTGVVRVYVLAYGQDLSLRRRRTIERDLGKLGAKIWSDIDTSNICMDDLHVMMISETVTSLAAIVPHIKKMKHWRMYRTSRRKNTSNIADDVLLHQYLHEFNFWCVYPRWANDCLASMSLLLPPPPDDSWPYLPNSTNDDPKKRKRVTEDINIGDSQGSHGSTKISRRTKPSFRLNNEVAASFKELSVLHQEMAVSNDDNWKAYSLRICASRLERLDFEVATDTETLHRLRRIKGFGDGTIDKIMQYLTEGKLRRIEEFKSDPDRLAIQRFTNIWGVGLARARELSNEGYKSIDDILEGLHKGRLQLDRNQLVGVECYDDIHDNNRMERSEVEEISRIVKKTADSLFPGIEVTIMGSYRREKRSCGDVDLHLTHPRFDADIPSDALGRIINSLWDGGWIAFHLVILNGMSVGLELQDFVSNSRRVRSTAWMQTKRISSDQTSNRHTSFWMGVMNSPIHAGVRRRVDIKFYPYRERVFASIYFTGNGYFNRSMRLWATYKHGMKLSDHGLFDRATGKERMMEASHEKEVFDFLGIKWKEPKERDGFDAMEPKNDQVDDDEDIVFKNYSEFLKDSEENIWVK